MSGTNKNLFNLDELSDYKVAQNYKDVRGWEVKDANNRTVGVVDHLLVNKTVERVVYLDVEVDETLLERGYKTYKDSVSDGVHEFLNKEGENHLIIPIGMVAFDRDNKVVNTDEIDSSTFAKAKRFTKGDAIDFEQELFLLRHYKGDHSIHSVGTVAGFYEREDFTNAFFLGDW